MKVGLFTSLRIDHDSISSLLKALEDNTQVSEIIILDPTNVELAINSHGVSFDFDGLTLSKDLVDVLIIRGGFSDIQSTRQVIAYAKQIGIKVFDNNLDEIGYLINKKADLIKLGRAGLPIVPTKFYTTMDQIKHADFTYPLIIKTANTGQGKNVHKVNSLPDLLDYILELSGGEKSKMHRILGKLIFQEFIDYQKDIRLFVLGDSVIGAMERIPKEGEFRANFSLGGAVKEFQAPIAMQELAVQATKSCGLIMCGIDVLIDKQGNYYVLEANHTPGIAGISEAIGFNLAVPLIEYVLKTL